ETSRRQYCFRRLQQPDVQHALLSAYTATQWAGRQDERAGGRAAERASRQAGVQACGRVAQ
ncbi:hypothetical protein LPJ73_003258, partial [Coemansia sp. RSA 2703]